MKTTKTKIKSKFTSIRFTILFIILCTSLIPLLIMGLSFYKIAEHSLFQATISQLNVMAEEESKKLNQRISYIIQHIRSFQNDPILLKEIISVESYLDQSRSEPYQAAMTKISEILSPFQKSENLTNIFVLNNDKVIYATDQNFLYRYLNKSLNEVYITKFHPMKEKGISYSDIYQNTIREGEYDILIMAQLEDKNGTSLGEIAFEIPLSSFQQYMSATLPLGYTTESILLNQEDLRLISTPRFEKSLALKMSVNFGKMAWDNSDRLLIQDYRQHYVYAVAKPIYGLPWIFLNKIDVSELQNTINNIMRYTLFFIITISVILAISLIMIAVYLSREITEPIKKLAFAAKNIKAENFKPRIDKNLLHYNNEIGLLANSLVAMSNELDQYSESLQDARKSAQAANLAKSNFLASMSHELRTPLNAVIGYSEMLAEELQDKNLHELLPDVEKVNISGRHLLSLISDILDISKIEAGKMELSISEFDVNQLLSDITAMAKPLAEKRNNQFIVVCSDDHGLMKSDILKLKQSILNLISNACKFTENGTVTLSVSKFRYKNESWIEFEINDTGIGIPQEQLEKLFKAFSQVNTPQQYGGTGLGLFISLKFCKMMGGDIKVNSVVNQGTSFIIELPMEIHNHN